MTFACSNCQLEQRFGRSVSSISITVWVFFNIMNIFSKKYLINIARRALHFALQFSSYIFQFFFIQIKETWQIFNMVSKYFFSCRTWDLSKLQLFSQNSFNKEHTPERKEKQKQKQKKRFLEQYSSYLNFSIRALSLACKTFWNKNFNKLKK